MTARLAGKTIVVTAAAHGIGRACAERCASEGARVIATDLDEAALDGLNAEKIGLDGTNASATAESLGGLEVDGLIHCIGMVHHGNLLDADEAAWRRSFAVNVDSAYHAIRAVLPGMAARQLGSVVLISSVASSVRGLPNRAVYGATKAALIGLAKSVAIDFVAQKIRCNAVCPGTVDTPSLRDRVRTLGEQVGGIELARKMFVDRQPMGRLGTAEEVAALCAYLVSNESAFLTGQALSMDGGITI